MEIYRVDENEAGQRLDHYLSRALGAYSRARLQEWIESGRARVNGEARKAAYKLRAGDAVTVEPAELKPLRAFAEEIALDVLYEDADVVVINKPAGMVVHAGAGAQAGTLVNALLHHFETLSGVGGELRPGIVHRIDKGTSGVLVVAKTDTAHRNLAAQFAGRAVEKVYTALVEGVVKGESGKIERAITRDPERRTRMTARLGTGRAAYSEYRVTRRYARHTLLEVRIGTGRTHQIRVHLAYVGHPIVGDTLYGAARQPELERPFLHARRIAFASPADGRRIQVEAPLPEKLVAFLARTL